jgi:hypothetical protein
MDEFDRAERLHREAAEQRINVIDADIDLAMTFLQLALTALSMSHYESADQLLEKAHVAHDTMAKFLPQVADVEQQQRLQAKHQTLTDTLAEVERKRMEARP